jgi:hypothetical protein
MLDLDHFININNYFSTYMHVTVHAHVIMTVKIDEYKQIIIKHIIRMSEK